MDWKKEDTPRITVAIPCYNEAQTIAKVVADFQKELPAADIVVFDNASTDGTAEVALRSGAAVVREKRRGKGYVVQSIFDQVDCDLCVMVDGDDTYEAADVHKLIEPVCRNQADMVVGDRHQAATDKAFTDLRKFGNRLILWIINTVFGTSFSDVLSGYRAMNRNFLQTVPLITGGFETETELTLQALAKGMVIREIATRYRERPSGSHSKLSPFGDGYRILITIVLLLRSHRPLYFFTFLAMLLVAISTGYGALWAYGQLPAFEPWFHGILLGGMVVLAGSLVIVGLVMNAINTGFREIASLQKRKH